MPPPVDVQNTSGELQLELNSFSGLTLPGKVAGVGMIGPYFLDRHGWDACAYPWPNYYIHMVR
jgi:hypothetical protein